MRLCQRANWEEAYSIAGVLWVYYPSYKKVYYYERGFSVQIQSRRLGEQSVFKLVLIQTPQIIAAFGQDSLRWSRFLDRISVWVSFCFIFIFIFFNNSRSKADISGARVLDFLPKKAKMNDASGITRD